jgi:hypothetical protein
MGIVDEVLGGGTVRADNDFLVHAGSEVIDGNDWGASRVTITVKLLAE